MEFRKMIRLKDGRECMLRHATQEDARGVLDCFVLTHAETDYLTTLPSEVSFTVEQEAEFLKKKAGSADEIEILAELDGKVVGTAGIDRVRANEKLRHRAGFGISVERDCWGLGVGRAMTEACIACAKTAGYAQLELEVVADNARAIALYRSVGFEEYGRNPRGFRSPVSGWQTLVLMRLELDG